MKLGAVGNEQTNEGYEFTESSQAVFQSKASPRQMKTVEDIYSILESEHTEGPAMSLD